MMDAYFSPKKNITLMRYTFFTCRQEEFERFDQFVIKLKTLVRDCDLGTLQGELVKDMIVIGTCDSRLQEQLLSKSDLTLEMAIKAGQTAEATKKNLSHLGQERKAYQIQKEFRNKPSANGKFTGDKNNTISNCKYCSFSHVRGKRGHFKRRCQSKTVDKFDDDRPDLGNDNEEVFFIGTIDKGQMGETSNVCSIGADKSEWNVTLTAHDSKINFIKIDTGAQVNILPKTIYNQLRFKLKLEKSSIKLKAYNGTPIYVLGTCTIPIKYKDISIEVRFIVADTNAVPILGLETSVQLKLINV